MRIALIFGVFTVLFSCCGIDKPTFDNAFVLKNIQRNLISCDSITIWLKNISHSNLTLVDIYKKIGITNVDSFKAEINLLNIGSHNIGNFIVNKYNDTINKKIVSRIDIQSSNNIIWIIYQNSSLEDILCIRYERESEWNEIYINAKPVNLAFICSLISDNNFILNLIENPKMKSIKFTPPLVGV